MPEILVKLWRHIHLSLHNLSMLMRLCLFGGKLHRQLHLHVTKKKRKIEDNKALNLCDQQRKKEQEN